MQLHHFVQVAHLLSQHPIHFQILVDKYQAHQFFLLFLPQVA
jgi:hypothetical protein